MKLQIPKFKGGEIIIKMNKMVDFVFSFNTDQVKMFGRSLLVVGTQLAVS